MRFCWHNYTMWSKVMRSYGGSLHQVCSCTKCGAIKRRQAIHSLAALLDEREVNAAIAETVNSK